MRQPLLCKKTFRANFLLSLIEPFQKRYATLTSNDSALNKKNGGADFFVVRNWALSKDVCYISVNINTDPIEDLPSLHYSKSNKQIITCESTTTLLWTSTESFTVRNLNGRLGYRTTISILGEGEPAK